MNIMFLSEPLDLIVFMLPDTFHEIRRHTDVQRPIRAAGEHINARSLFHSKIWWIPDYGLGDDNLVVTPEWLCRAPILPSTADGSPASSRGGRHLTVAPE